MDDGLAANYVNGFVQDGRGYMWIYGGSFLSRYDGYEIVQYKKEHKGKWLVGNINSTCIDSNGELWVLSAILSKYDQSVDSFAIVETYVGLDGEEHKIQGNGFSNLVKSPDGSVLINNNRGKILKYYLEQGVAKEIQLPLPPEIKPKKNEHPRAVFVDGDGTLWYQLSNTSFLVKCGKDNKTTKIDYKHLGYGNMPIREMVDDITGENLLFTSALNIDCFFVLNKKDHTIRKIRHYTGDQTAEKEIDITGIVPYDENIVLVGYKRNMGLKAINIQTGEQQLFEHDINFPNSLTSNHVLNLYRSPDGLIWIATQYGGANILDLNLKPFKLYRKQGFDLENSLSDNMITSYLEGQDGTIWIGTDQGGLNKFDPETGKFKHYIHDPKDKHSISAKQAIGMAETEDGMIWIGTWSGGLNKFNPKTGKFKAYRANDDKPEGLACDHVWQVAVSTDNQVWVGYNFCGNNGVAFSKFDPKTEKFTHFYSKKGKGNFPPAKGAEVLYADPYNNLWVGVRGFMYKYDIKRDGFIFFEDLSAKLNIACFLSEDEDRIWLGTKESGLFLFDQKTKNIKIYDVENNGLPSNSIRAIQKDKEGNLWLGTSNGLSKFNPQTGAVSNYGVKDKMQSKSFDDGSMYTSTGEMYFGGVKGLNVFRPEEIKVNNNIPPVHITKFNLFNKEVSFKDENSPLKGDISTLKELVLTHEQNIFSFELTALNFTNTDENQYAYMLEGFEKNWNYIGENRQATYTNIGAGEYVFRAKAANNEGIWNENGVTLKVTILPPWWETWWFRTLVGLIVVGGSVAFYKYRMHTIKKQKRVLELKVEERTSELQVANEEMAQQAEELEQQRDYLQDANESISKKNDMITASINYAQRIQQAILPMEEELSGQFDDHFVLFRPRDVVSGDFYWMHESEEATFIAVVDCTGHGVPGAFMSMIGSSLLNRIVGEMKITDPANILKVLHKNVVKALRQEATYNRDGMDMALCAIYKGGAKGKVVFAGAKSSLFVQQPTKESVDEYISSRMSVGGSKAEKLSFESEEFMFDQGTVLYLTTDGYIDQHRASDRRRLGRKRLREQLEKVKGKNLVCQKELLENYLIEYMGDEPQRDDIALIGIRL
ncbi:two-component regulator propeller domain-containing protein [Flammeovirgaceae bacterium SG7u.132]|nr:two-component regulator propeller domain-containing protein [Flammeovirgaceae bacterium SG7u.132]